MAEKIDAFHLHEVTDRAHMIATMVDELLGCHDAVRAYPSLSKAVNALEEAAAHLYQVAGRIEHDHKPT